MSVNISLFSQIIKQLDRNSFNRLVTKHDTDKASKGFDSWTHLVSMLFCQFANSSSLRDISNGLRSATGNLNHLGVKKAPSKSSISYQNARRTSDLFQSYYFEMLNHFGQQLKISKSKLRIKAPVHLLDSTTISLCLSLFDWAKYKTNKGAVKMHTLLDYEGGLPLYVNISDGKTGDNKGAYNTPVQKGAVIVADRYYNDFKMLNVWDSKEAYFVVRHKNNLKYDQVDKRIIPPVRQKHIIVDQEIKLSNTNSYKKYPKKLRRLSIWDEVNEQYIQLITNNFTWSADTISKLYKARWTIEIFFRDIKQLLHIKTFIGTSENAVKIQIWSALITILLLKMLRHIASYPWYLSNLVAFLRLNLFVKIDLFKWLDNPFCTKPQKAIYGTQGVLF